MTETPITRDLAGLAQALRDEADLCETLGITNPAALMREAAAVIQVDANSDTMDMFAEVTSVGHLAELVDELRRQLHMLADHWDCEEVRGHGVAETLRELADGGGQPTKLLSLIAPDQAQADRVRRIEENGPYPGMSVAFERYMGDDQSWTDPMYTPDASLWAAAWKAATKHAADGFRAQAARDAEDLRMQQRAQLQALPEEQWPETPSAYRGGDYIGFARTDLLSYARQVLAAHGLGA